MTQAPGAVEIVVDVPPDHPVFAGHFPGRPILPGAVLLGWVLDAALDRAGPPGGGPDRPVLIRQAKFHAPVPPGMRLAVRLHPPTAASAGIEFEVTAGRTRIASGSLVVGPQAGGSDPMTRPA